MASPSTTEIVVFVLILLSSFALFFRRAWRIGLLIFLARPDPGRAFFQPGVGPWQFIRDVLLQWKVIQTRPWVGLAHALVFWGFCAFALISIDHLLKGFGVHWLDRQSGVGAFWFQLALFFSIAVSMAISALAIRRFLIRPKWLGSRVSLESGIIAGLILILMLTYIAECAGMRSKANWWVHTVALLSFLPLIPGTKHLHLLLSPAAVLLKHREFAHVPPLQGDEDFGLDSGKDISRIAALQAFSCVECGRCMEQCPASTTGKTLNPKEIALGFREYLKANGPGSAEPLLGAHLASEAAFQCTTCGACEAVCPVGVQHLPLIIGLRRGAVNTGKWEDDHGADLFLKLERYGNPLGMSASERDKFIQKSNLPLFDGTQQYLLWMGCMGSYDPQGRETILALAKTLRHAGISFGVLKKEKCTGDAARRLGNDLAFQQLAEFNIAQIEAASPARIVSPCPHCVRTIATDWREFGAAFEVEHHSETLSRLGLLPQQTAGATGIVYHDPCYLGRYRGVYEPPRQLVRLAGRLVEPPRSAERAFCCGAGGGMAFLGEEKGKRISHERAEELVATGAGAVAAACPFCHTMLKDALTAVAPGREPRLVDVAVLAAERLSSIRQ